MGGVMESLEAAGLGLLQYVNLTLSYTGPRKTWKDRKEERNDKTKKIERVKMENIVRQ
jgi:hypothetical protein